MTNFGHIWHFDQDRRTLFRSNKFKAAAVLCVAAALGIAAAASGWKPSAEFLSGWSMFSGPAREAEPSKPVPSPAADFDQYGGLKASPPAAPEAPMAREAVDGSSAAAPAK